MYLILCIFIFSVSILYMNAVHKFHFLKQRPLYNLDKSHKNILDLLHFYTVDSRYLDLAYLE